MAQVWYTVTKSDAMTHRTPTALRAKFIETLICFAKALGVRTRPRVAFDCWTYVFIHKKARLREGYGAAAPKAFKSDAAQIRARIRS